MLSRLMSAMVAAMDASMAIAARALIGEARALVTRAKTPAGSRFFSSRYKISTREIAESVPATDIADRRHERGADRPSAPR
jgi:hypothetical protein